MACDPQTLVSEAACLEQCVSANRLRAITVNLLCAIRDGLVTGPFASTVWEQGGKTTLLNQVVTLGPVDGSGNPILTLVHNCIIQARETNTVDVLIGPVDNSAYIKMRIHPGQSYMIPNVPLRVFNLCTWFIMDDGMIGNQIVDTIYALA